MRTAMKMFDTRRRVVDSVDVALAQAFADAATIAMRQQRAARKRG
jgi:hypothetical protein